MKHVNLGKWEIVITPFPKLTSTVHRHGGHRTTFLALLGNIKHQDNILAENTFSVIKSATKGTILITDRPDNTKRILLTTTLSDGFRGSSGYIKEDTTGTILAEAQCSSACDGGSTYACLLDVDQQMVTYSRGRRTDIIWVHTNIDGELNTVEFTGEEYRTMKNISVSSDDVEIL